jgi:hypothetical protein
VEMACTTSTVIRRVPRLREGVWRVDLLSPLNVYRFCGRKRRVTMIFACCECSRVSVGIGRPPVLHTKHPYIYRQNFLGQGIDGTNGTFGGSQPLRSQRSDSSSDPSRTSTRIGRGWIPVRLLPHVSRHHRAAHRIVGNAHGE